VRSEAVLRQQATPVWGGWIRARRRSRCARRRPPAIGSALALATWAWLLTASPAGAAPSFKDGHGLHVSAVTQLDPRLVEVTVTTAALPGPAHVRILLPSNYYSRPTQRFPVFYLLHGTSGGASDWTEKGSAERTTEGLPMVVVMPDIALNGDGGGWCTNWPDGKYGWETFHVQQLIPWVDANLHTIAARKGRAIAGLSQGGFCSTSYAARHPDLFSTVLGYSGAPDIAYDAKDAAGSTAIINATEVGLDGVPPNSMFGDRATNEINWATHDPATLANNLRGMNILMYWGNGQPGPLDPTPPEAGAMSIEALVNEDNIDFRSRLQSLAIPAFYNDYGRGTHSWPYWTRDLQESIGPIAADFAHPPAAPKSITYTIADAQYSVFGWSVAMHRTAEEFSTLQNASKGGFALAGSGSGTVVTPPVYPAGAQYAVALHGQGIDSGTTVTAGADRRLEIEVPLGPANPYQEDSAQAMATGTSVYTTTVSISKV
jgi:S-formylglutathione hydrolase FrmB